MGPLQNKPVLLVEDDEISQMVAANLLRSLGAALSIASTGKEALSMISMIAYDVILLDIGLPDMSGCDVARILREQERNFGQKRASIIALSADVGTQEVQLWEAGIDSVLLKPLDAARLLNALLSETVSQAEGHVVHKKIDFTWLEKNLGDSGLCQETLKDAVDIFPEYLHTLRELTEGDRFEEVARLTHRFGGAAASIGAFALAKAIKEFGASIKARDFTGLQKEMDNFLEAAGGVLAKENSK